MIMTSKLISFTAVNTFALQWVHPPFCVSSVEAFMFYRGTTTTRLVKEEGHEWKKRESPTSCITESAKDRVEDDNHVGGWPGRW